MEKGEKLKKYFLPSDVYMLPPKYFGKIQKFFVQVAKYNNVIGL